MLTYGKLWKGPPPLQVIKTGSSLHIIMYKLHISSWWVAPAFVTSSLSSELKSQVASNVSPAGAMQPDFQTRYWGGVET
jgi:hypothetical protein